MELAGDQLSQFFSSLQDAAPRVGPNSQDSGFDHDNPENTGPIDPAFADFISEYGNPSSLDRMPESHYWDFLTQGIDPEFQATAIGPNEIKANYSAGQVIVSGDQGLADGGFDGKTAHFNVNGLDLIGTFHADGKYHSGSIDPDTGKLDVVVTAPSGALTHWTFDVDPSHAPGDPYSNILSNGVASSGESGSSDNSFPNSYSRRESLAPYLDKPHMKEGETRHLTDGEKAALRDFYGDKLTDAQMNSVIIKSGGAYGDASATTWSKNNISFNTKTAITDYSTDNSTMALLIHEFTHVIQWNEGYSLFRFGKDEVAGAFSDAYSYNEQTFNDLLLGKINFKDLNVETQAALKEDAFRAEHGLPTLGNYGFDPGVPAYREVQLTYDPSH